MKLDSVVVGKLKTNCYVLTKDNKCLIIDPGDDVDKIMEIVGNKMVVGVLVTHSHFDHIGALHYFDSNIVYDHSNLSEGKHHIDEFDFDVYYTPGHKSDSISFYFESLNILFTGDFIFFENIGRTDLETGNAEDMKTSLLKISLFKDDVKIYPGHGKNTFLGYEREHNFYLRGVNFRER